MIKIALAGDILITRPLPVKGYNGLQELIDLISSHEVKFANLETTVHRREGYPSAFPGGTWAMTDPVCLKDIKRFGFNILNTANNHAMDYSHNGLLATQNYLLENDLLFAGTGENLADAAAAAFVECSEGRVAVIGATSSFHDSDAAGNQRLDMKGRPGVNPLRHKAIYEVTEENLKNLEKIANDVHINDYHNQAIKEGYLLSRDNFNFANLEFKKGKTNILHTFPLEKDLERISKSITEARRQSDCVMVSLHSHQFANGDKIHPAEFMRICARSCIDAGASIIVGHGPHILRGIEVYKHGVIFYSLGNFIFQNETVSHLPAEFYEKYSLQYNDGVGTAMDGRSKNGTIGLNTDKEAWNSVLVSVEIEHNRMNVDLFPVELGYDLPRYKKGMPKLINSESIISRVKELSFVFNTNVRYIDGIGNIVIPQ
jgi:poly-gamma-glutamate capsule biosynthesis protein CapA/YwtB (metallophosphatase superfamily)